MVAISQLWYNGSYTIAAKPIKTLESHYTMIQFLIKYNSSSADRVATVREMSGENLFFRSGDFTPSQQNSKS